VKTPAGRLVRTRRPKPQKPEGRRVERDRRQLDEAGQVLVTTGKVVFSMNSGELHLHRARS
jgi:hypothetical protein